MMLTITRHAGVVSSRTNIKWVTIPSSRINSCRIRTYTYKILMAVILGAIYARKPNFSFNPIKKNGSYQLKAKHLPIYCWIRYESHQKQYKYAHHEKMTPNQFCHFNGFIKNILHFMYGLNLHIYSPSYFCIISLKHLKSPLENKEFFNFLSYSCKKSNTSGLKVK